MSQRGKPQGTDLQPFVQTTVKIVRILEVKKKWIETLACVVYGKEYFPDGDMPVSMSEAMNEFNKTAFSTGGGHSSNSDADDDEEPIDIELFMAQSGTQKDDAFFDIANESRFISLKKLVDVEAKCLCEFNLAGGRRMDPVTNKRMRVAPAIRRVVVQGYFPCLSPACRFDVSGDIAGSEAVPGFLEAPQLVRTTRSECYIKPSPTPYAQIQDLIDMLKHGPRMGLDQIRFRLRDLFPALYQLTEPAFAESERSTLRFVPYDSMVKLYADNEVPDDPALAVRDGRVGSVWFEVAALRTAMCNSQRVDLNFTSIDNDKVLFSTAWLFLFGKELNLIAEIYAAGRRWQEVLVRGPALIAKLYDMLLTEPYLLCFHEIKRAEAIRAQKQLQSYGGGGRGNSLRTLTLRRERSTLFCLSTLPDLSYKQLRRMMGLAQERGYQWKLQGADVQLVIVAVDVYGLMRMSMQHREDLVYDTAHQMRIDAAVHKSSGHMYTVFDNSQLTELEGFDAAAAHGTLCLGPALEEEKARLDRETRAENPLAVPEQMRPTPGQHHQQQPVRTNDDDDNDDNTFSVPYVPAIRPTPTTTQQQPPQILHSYLDVRQRLCNNDITPQQLVLAIEWLVKHHIVIRETMTGTGPENKGCEFDAFYIASVHKSQERSVGVLSDIYGRGVRTAVRQPALATKYDVAECQALSMYKERMRVLLKSLTYKHIALINDERTQHNANDLPAITDETQQKRKATLTSLYAMARELVRSLDDFLSNAPDKTSDACGKSGDEMSDYARPMTNCHTVPANLRSPTEEIEAGQCVQMPPIKGKGLERRLTFRLLKRAEVIERDTLELPGVGGDCVPEQQRAIDGALASPIYICTGRGGTGKTWTVERIAEALVPCQTLFVAPTGRVATELRRRLGAKALAQGASPIEIPEASTIHSVLFREVLHKKEQVNMRALFPRLATSLSESAEHLYIVKVRQRLFEFCGGLKHPSPFDGKRTLVIEEMSLVPYALYAELLSAAHPMTLNSNAFLEKILLCGDVKQLPAIGYGVVLRDMCRAYPANVGHLTINHRSVTNPKIFDFATAVSEGKLTDEALRIMRDFKSDNNTPRLLASTMPQFDGTETPEQAATKRAQANDASMCCVAAGDKDMGSTIKYVLRTLGALEDPPTPRSMAIRHSIIMVAPMNYQVERANSVVRGLYRASQVRAAGGIVKPNESTGDATLPPDFNRRIMIGDRIAFCKNFHEVYNVPDAIEDHHHHHQSGLTDDDDEAPPAGVALACDQMQVDAPVLAALEPVPLTEEQKATMRPDAGAHHAITKLTKRAFATNLITTVPSKSVVVQFNNGEPLVVAGAYNRPAKTNSQTSCACGMHPPPLTAGQPFVQHECVYAPHVVPILRRRIADINDHNELQWHDQAFDYRDKSERIRRQLVLASLHVPDIYKEVDIRRRLVTQADWKFVEAETINVLQGSEADIVLILVTSDNAHFGRAAMYTALTRARGRVVVIGMQDYFERACRRSDIVQASDFWFKLAHEANKVHVELAAQGVSPRMVAASMAVRSSVAERMYEPTHAESKAKRAETWRLYDDVKKHAVWMAASEFEEAL